MDDIFKNKLFDHSEEVPSDMWDNILAAQQKEKRRKKVLFIWLLCGILSSASLIGYFFSQGDLYNRSAKPIPDIELESRILTKTKNNNLINVSVFNAHKNHVVPTDYSKISEVEITPTSANGQEDSVDENANSNNSYNNGIDNSLIVNSSGHNTFSSKIVGHAISMNNENQVIPSTLLNNSRVNEKVLTGVNINETSLLSSKNLNTLALPITSLDNSLLNKALQKVECPKFNSVKGNFFIEGLYSVNLNIKRLSSKIGVEGNSYLLKRLDSERALYSSSSLIKIGYQFPMKLSLASGLEYGQITERFSYENLDAIKTKTVITFDTTFLNDGSYTTKADTFRIITHGSEITRVVNRYRTLDIPLSVCYAIDGKRLDVLLKASALFNIYFQPTGKILGLKDKPVSLHNLDIDEGLALKKKLRTRFDLAVGFNFHLNHHLDLSVEPYFKTSTGDISRPSSILEQSYTTLGLRMGVKYIFNN